MRIKKKIFRNQRFQALISKYNTAVGKSNLWDAKAYSLAQQIEKEFGVSLSSTQQPRQEELLSIEVSLEEN